MLRPAIEQTITAFEEREGVRVPRVYNGCGILVAQMKAGQVPDAYFACDVEFMKQVQALFPDSEDDFAERAGHPREEGESARHWRRCAIWPSPTCASASATRSSARWAG